MYDKIKYYKENYARPGYPDKRAVADFIECESREVVSSLKAAMAAIANGNFNPDSLNVLIGRDRIARHGSYEEWAKMMMLWMASASK